VSVEDPRRLDSMLRVADVHLRLLRYRRPPVLASRTRAPVALGRSGGLFLVRGPELVLTRARWHSINGLSKLLLLDSWTQRQGASVLCNDNFEDSAISTERAKQRSEAHRRAEQLIDAAIRAGELVQLPSLNEPPWIKAVEAANPTIAEEIRRASGASHLYGAARHFRPELMIKWGTMIPGRFPHCVITINDLPRAVQPDTLDPRERNSLLIMIAALSKLAGIDINQTSKAAAVIEAQTKELGAGLSARTIVSHLEHVPAVIKSRLQ